MSASDNGLHSGLHQCQTPRCAVSDSSGPPALLESPYVTSSVESLSSYKGHRELSEYDTQLKVKDTLKNKTSSSRSLIHPIKDPFTNPIKCSSLNTSNDVSPPSRRRRGSEVRKTRRAISKTRGLGASLVQCSTSIYDVSHEINLLRTVESILSEASEQREYEDEVASLLYFADVVRKEKAYKKKHSKSIKYDEKEVSSVSLDDNARKNDTENSTSETGSTHSLLVQRVSEKYASQQSDNKSGVETPSGSNNSFSSPTVSFAGSASEALVRSSPLSGETVHPRNSESQSKTSQTLKGLFFTNILSKIQRPDDGADLVAKFHSGSSVQISESSAKNSLFETNTDIPSFNNLTKIQHPPNRKSEMDVPVKRAGSGKNINGRVMKPNVALKSKVVLIGDSGSGKTTFKSCFTSSVLRSLPNVSPSLTSSSSKFHYSSTGSHTKLSVTVIDSGPVPLKCGITSFYDNNCMFIMTLTLAGVKQKCHPKKGVSFGPAPPPEVIIHDDDKNRIRSYIRSIAAVATKNTSFCLVGTGTDMLSDSSPKAVRDIVSTLRNLVLMEFSSIALCNIMFRGCYAVSCVDHKVTSESKTDVHMYISDMWNLLCETMIKDAMSNIGGIVLETPATFGWTQDSISSAMGLIGEKVHTERINTFASPTLSKPLLGMMGTSLVAKFISDATTNKAADMMTQVACSGLFTVEELKKSFNFKRLFSDKESASHLDENFAIQTFGTAISTGLPEDLNPQISRNESNANISPENSFHPGSFLVTDDEKSQAALLQATHRGRLFVARAKSELNLIVIPMKSIEQHFYSLGITSKAHCENVLNGLVRENEIAIFKSQSTGREDTILLQPHILSRVMVALVNIIQYSSYPIAERKRIEPAIDHEEIEGADPTHQLSLLGHLNDSIIVTLSSCISEYRELREDCAEILLYLLIAADILLVCRSADLIPDKTNENNLNNNPTILGKPSGTHAPSKMPNRGIPCRFKGFGWRFVIPSFVRKPIPSTGMQGVRAILHLSARPPTHRPRDHLLESVCYTDMPHRLPCSKANDIGGIETMEKHFSLHPYPPFLQYHLLCRLAAYVASPNCVFSNGVWLSHPTIGCRALIIFTSYDFNAASATAYTPSSSNSKSTSNQRHQFLCGSDATVDIYVISSAGGKLAAVPFMANIMTEIERVIQNKTPGTCLRAIHGKRYPINAESTDDCQYINTYEKIAQYGGKRVISELDRAFSIAI